MEESFDIEALTADLDISALCCDEEFDGFDKLNGNTWIYPTNYPVRDYQYNIIKAALYKNTLVSLPTGLGKTFIAAVIMYNFYRWYPMGKIIFVAPTRPLVAQQIDACYNIMAIPPDDTIEMTGTMSVVNRKTAWLKKRVIFATPQVVQNDLESGNCPSELVRCLVIDEAHKSKGRYAFCQIIEYLTLKKHHLYRVLALSATPGSKVEDVVHVVKNLNISHLELRSEECIDVAAYSFSRKIQTIVVPLGMELGTIRAQFLEILDQYTRRLVQFKVLTGNIGALSKGRVIMLFKEYQGRERTQRNPQHGQIMLDFTMVITLYHALELLTRHGARVFLNFFDEHPDKTWVSKDYRLVSFLERLRDDLGVNPMTLDLNTFPDGSYPEIKDNILYGHPKFDHLKRIISEHFNNAKYKGQNTKAIVFCEYRESVNLVHCLLLQCRPLIKPHIFIGQGPGSGNGKDIKVFSQKQQLKVMKNFREGACNVLVSTCVGEEGLDIGNVDLIVCFDISNKSPVRLVQRCGRTGRERSGHVVILVTEGKEHQTLRDCMYERDNMNKKILNSKQLQEGLFKNSPRMIPLNFKPECQKMFITVPKKNSEDKSKSTKVQSKLKDMLIKLSSNNSINLRPAFLSENEFVALGHYNFSNFFVNSTEIWNETKDYIHKSDTFPNDILSKRVEYQRSLQYTSSISHSIDSCIFSELLKFADAKRFNVPVGPLKPDFFHLSQSTKSKNITETVTKSVTMKKQVKLSKGAGDIRKMFRNIAKANNVEEAVFSSKLEEILNECGIDTDSPESINSHLELENVSNLLVDLMIELELDGSQCHKNTKSKFSSISVPKIDSILPKIVLADYCLPDISCIYSICSISWVDLKSKLDSMTNTANNTTINLENNHLYPDFNDDNNSYNHYSPELCMSENNANKTNHDLIDIEGIFEDSVLLLNEENNGKNCAEKESLVYNESKSGLGFFGIDDIDGIFDNSYSVSNNDQDISEKNKELESKTSVKHSDRKNFLNTENNRKSGLEFFGLNDIEDIYFDTSSNEFRNELELNIDSPTYNHNNDSNQLFENVVSPIISSQVNKKSNLANQSQSDIVENNLTKSFNKSTIVNKESTFFSISQAIDYISSGNTTSNGRSTESILENKSGQKISNNICINTKNINNEESNDSDNSIILCSQAFKPDIPLVKKSIMNQSISNQLNKPNIIIPASSEESDSDEVECFYKNNIAPKSDLCIDNDFAVIQNDVSDQNCNLTSEKRRLSSEEESSPFFHKFPKIENCSLKNITLLKKQANTAQASCTFNSDSTNCSDYIMKENISPKINEHDSDDHIANFKHIPNALSESNHFNRLNVSITSSLNLTSLKKYQMSRSKKISHCGFIEHIDSDDDFVETLPKRDKDNKDGKIFSKNKKIKVKKKREVCEFIDYEAILSEDSYEGGSSEDASGSDTTLGSFICDEIYDVDESVDINSKYLQSVKSPMNVGKFKIPKLSEENIDVFSQIPVQDTSYELDSFCVGNDIGLTQANEPTELELAESLLKKRKQRKFKRIIHADNHDTMISVQISPVKNENKRVKLRISSDSE